MAPKFVGQQETAQSGRRAAATDLSVAVHDFRSLLGVDAGPQEGGLPRVHVVLGLARQLELFPVWKQIKK